MVRAGVVLVCVGALIAAGTAISQSTEQVPMPAAPAAGPPNLVMHEILDIEVAPWHTRRAKPVAGRWAIRFSTIIDNWGPGHLVIRAKRQRVGKPCAKTTLPTNKCERGDMKAEQVIVLPGGKTQRVKRIGRVRYDTVHGHWHLRGVARYELRSASGKTLGRDIKTGFCLGDRRRYTPEEAPHYPGLESGFANCRYGNANPKLDGRRAKTLLEGISAGWSDDYNSYMHDGTPLEGQQLELTGLKAGRYLLVNRLPKSRMRQTTTADDAASVLFDLTWPNGPKAEPVVAVVASCTKTARCRPPAS